MANRRRRRGAILSLLLPIFTQGRASGLVVQPFEGKQQVQALSHVSSSASAARGMARPVAPTCSTALLAKGPGEEREVYSDGLTAFLGNFLPSEEPLTAEQLLVNRGEPLRTNLPAESMAEALEEGLRQHSWFVTGRCDQSLFSPLFDFVDPSVSLKGIGTYAEGVNKLFDQQATKMDVVHVDVVEGTIEVEWRLEGKVNLPFKPSIKPYLILTTFTRDEAGLLLSQEDAFQIAGWDIVLSAVVPPLGKLLGAKPAPPIDELLRDRKKKEQQEQ